MKAFASCGSPPMDQANAGYEQLTQDCQRKGERQAGGFLAACLYGSIAVSTYLPSILPTPKVPPSRESDSGRLLGEKSATLRGTNSSATTVPPLTNTGREFMSLDCMAFDRGLIQSKPRDSVMASGVV